MSKTANEERRAAYKAFMDTLGVINWDDENNQDTPNRVSKYYEDWLSPPEVKYTTFPAEGMDEMILVDSIPFFSLCAHHHLPFFGVGHVAYIPNERIVGLSKIPRTLEFYSRRFQNQERITFQVADKLNEVLKPKGVAVVLQARHMCMEMRGVRKHDTWTTTSKLLGVFNEGEARNEFLKLIKKHV